MHLIIREINKCLRFVLCTYKYTIKYNVTSRDPQPTDDTLPIIANQRRNNLELPSFLRDDMIINRVDVYAVSCSGDANSVIQSKRIDWLKCDVDIKCLRYQTVSLHMFQCQGR